MLNRKLLEVLSHLTAAEKKRLRLFLQSPYFNNTSNSDEIVSLYDLIIRHNAEETHPALSKEAVFNLFFPGKTFQEKSKSPLDSLTSELFGLVRRFLSQVELEKENEEVQEYLALAKFYRKFAFEDRYWQTIGSIRKLQDGSPWRDAKYYFNQFRLEEEELLFRGLYNSFADDVNLVAVHRNLDIYYSILKLDFTCALVYQQQFTPIEQLPTYAIVENVLSLTHDGGPFDIAINNVYRKLMEILKDSDEEFAVEALEAFIEEHKGQIPFEKMKEFSTYLQFLWSQRYRKSGGGISLQNTFNIYKKNLEQGYCYFDGLIQLYDFRNLVIIGLKLGEFEWVKNFLSTHTTEKICGTRYPAEAYSLNMAEYHFYLKQYDEALEGLTYRLFENPLFSLLSDVLLVKIYYETNNDLLEFRMKALDQKVRRSKLSPIEKNRYLNFLRKLDKIIKYVWQPRNTKRLQLIEEIKTTPEIIAREWLLEKLEK